MLTNEEKDVYEYICRLYNSSNPVDLRPNDDSYVKNCSIREFEKIAKKLERKNLIIRTKMTNGLLWRPLDPAEIIKTKEIKKGILSNDR